MGQEGAIRAQPVALIALVLGAGIAGWMALHRDGPMEPDASAARAKEALIDSYAVVPADAGTQDTQALLDPRLSGDNIDPRFPNRPAHDSAGAVRGQAPTLVPQPRSVVRAGRLYAPSVKPGEVPEPARASARVVGAPAGDAAPPVPVPQAPPLPFAFLGRLAEGGRWTVLLGRGNAEYVVREGDVIEGQWRVEAIDEAHIAFVYLPLGTHQRLGLRADAAAVVVQSGGETAARTLATATQSLQTAPGAAQMGAAPTPALAAAGPAAGATDASDEPARAQPPPAFERRVRPSEIPREPWVCAAARVNALVPCRNTWSMSEDERMACRKSAEQRFNACLSTAVLQPES